MFIFRESELKYAYKRYAYIKKVYRKIYTINENIPCSVGFHAVKIVFQFRFLVYGQKIVNLQQKYGA